MHSDTSDIEDNFPNLRGKRNVNYQITSLDTPIYNCVAWAASDQYRIWWPSNISYWPEGLPKNENTIANFLAAFKQLGYEVTDNDSYENGYEKVALYSIGSEPTHMARQLESGHWTSKLGKSFDISHVSLNDIEGDLYGYVVQILKRLRLTNI